MQARRKEFETTAATRRTAERAPREALVLCRASIERGTAASDNAQPSFRPRVGARGRLQPESRYFLAANDSRTAAKRRSDRAAPLVVVSWAPAFAGVTLRVTCDVWQVTDRQGRVTSYTYDRNRRMTAKTEPVTVAGVATTRTTQYSYYADGTLKELTDANGNVTRWEIDIQSRPVSKTYAFGTANAKTESYSYDLAGRLKTTTDAKGQVLTLVRNKDDSIASYAYTNAVIATPGASFTYDPWYPRRTGMTDQFGTTSWTYRAVATNGALNLQTENGPFNNDSLTLAYDNAGRVNSRTVSNTTAETFGFDTLGRMNSHVTQLGTFTYGYLGNSGQVSTRTIGGITTSWGYDTNTNDRRLLTISTTGAVARNFTYASNAYQITGITDTPAATHPWLGQSWSFSYDGSDRLLTGNGTIAGNATFQYDKLDNATGFAGAVASYNNLNQIAAWNSSTHTYDNNGNLTGDGTRTYTYDAADRLKTVTQGGTTTTFAYDGLGRRLKQTVGSTETRYLWCGAAICQQRSNTDVVQKRFFAEGEYVLTGTKKYLYLADHLGSVRDLVDITGTATLVGSFDYTPYGAVARSWGTVAPGYTYAGLFAHPSTGLLLSATRAYEPTKGRFLNRDPKKEGAAGENQYAYTLGNPVRWNDPTGLDVIITVGREPLPVTGNPGYPHSIIIITQPGTDIVIDTLVFWNGASGGEYASPGLIKYWKPEYLQPPLARIVTDERENAIALDYVHSKVGTYAPYEFGKSDCNTRALDAFLNIQGKIMDLRGARRVPELPPLNFGPTLP